MPSTVTNRLQGLTTSVAVKPPCVTVALSNVTLSGLQTISSVTVAEGDRVLVTAQTNGADNGIYVASTGSWVRATDFDGDFDVVQGTRVLVRNTGIDGAEYELTTANPIVIGTTSLSFSLRYGANATYDQTNAEIAAGVTPTQFQIPSEDIAGYVNPMRYMTSAQLTATVERTFAVDVRDAIANAILVAAQGCKHVHSPSGLYRLDSGVTVPNTGNWKVSGSGKTNTEWRASGTFSKLLTLGDTAAQSIRGCIQDIHLSGEDATLEYALYGARVEEHDFTRVWCSHSTEAGASIGFGYVNNYYQCEFSNCTGDGFVMNTDHDTGGNNANHFAGCLFYNNTGFGLVARSGHGLFLDGCTVEENDAGGIYLSTMTGYKITGYFEDNGATGHAFTTPSLTVNAHIIINGTSDLAEMSAATSSTGGEIGPCEVLSPAGTDAFVWNAGAEDLWVHHIRTPDSSVCPVVGEHYNNIYKGRGVRITDCSDFDSQIAYTGAASAINNTFAAYTEIDLSSIQLRNYAQTDLNQWASISSGSAVTYRRSTGGSTLYRLHGTDVWEFNTSAADASDVYGFAFASADYPELIGKLMWFGLWVYATDADPYIRPHCSEQSFNANPTTADTWTLLAVTFTWPASATVSFGARKEGSATSGSGYIAAPMLCELGVPAKKAIGLIQKPPRIWYGGAAPTAGTWEDGDTVLNSAPAAGGAPGWVCTTAGSPGTWKAMASLAA